MQAMMKKIFVLFAILLLCSCAPSTSSWDNARYSRPAQSAPSQLTRQSLEQSPEQNVYSPYSSPAENKQHASYDGTMPQEKNADTSYEDRIHAVDPRTPDTPYQDTRPASPYQQAPQSAIQAAPVLPKVNVALLLPLSGQHSDLGQSMLQAAQLALFDMGYQSFELMPRDTRGTPQGATQAAQSVINEGAQLILGPLFASSVNAVKPVANRYNVNMIAFSTDWSLAGGNVYVMGFLPFAQVQRVSEYAVQNGVNSIGILAPNTDYGNAVIAAYNSLAYRTGINTAEVLRFSPEESDTSSLIRSFTKYDERVQNLEELKLALKDRLKQNPADKSARIELKELENADTWGELPFDAVLLPVGGDMARSIGNLLSFYDLGPDDVKRLGTGLWDDRGLATEPALEGSWFAAPSPDLRRDFELRYEGLYGSRPARLATLAYDATALAAVLAKNSYASTGYVRFQRNDLINPNGFAGVDGIFRFRPDGLIERGLAILEYNGASIKVLDPAPTTFQRPVVY
jgi:ABC-type branched-subunit amino acid transport system substrate-binding protein